MVTRRLNVLVYAGRGTTTESVKHCLFTFRRLLSPNYAVLPLSTSALLNEPWPPSAALLIIPGGADRFYCSELNGKGNRRIRSFVEGGGSFIGFCAGGYYGTAKCEFEVGDTSLEVIGERELAFFPGTCRGCAFKGFVYHSEIGAKAARLKVDRSVLSGSVPEGFRAYYNGGGVFVGAKGLEDRGVQVLAEYEDPIAVDGGDGRAAIVYCKVGEGSVILTGPHPEFAAVNLPHDEVPDQYYEMLKALVADEPLRNNFLKACLNKLGLEVNETDAVVPSLSKMHLSALQPKTVGTLMDDLAEIIKTKADGRYIEDEADTFHFEESGKWSMKGLKDSVQQVLSDSLPSVVPPPIQKDETSELDGTTEDKILDYSKMVKKIVPHGDDYPTSEETPYFNHENYFENLQRYQAQTRDCDPLFGSCLLYGEVVTSTSSILEKNTQLLRRLPVGTTALATIQVAGRGRSNNVWVSPAGSMLWSFVVRHPQSLMSRAPVIFLQYIAAIGVVEAIRTYERGFDAMSIRLKWPNDIYASDPKNGGAFTKIGGILVNSHYSSDEYISVVGIGLNLNNSKPTTSLAALKPDRLPPLTIEKLLARFMTVFSGLYTRFCRVGWDEGFERMYYSAWLHSEQIITLAHESASVIKGTGSASSGSGEGYKVKVVGITRDWGQLLCEDLSGSGRQFEVTSDGNSFDFFKGLVKRKDT